MGIPSVRIHRHRYPERFPVAKFQVIIRRNARVSCGLIDGSGGNSRKVEVSSRRISEPARLRIGDVIRHGTRCAVPLGGGAYFFQTESTNPVFSNS